MKRIIKFRGRDLKTGEFVFGDLETRPKEDFMVIHQYHEDGSYKSQVKVDPDTVGQFTGWSPRKCGDLYDGDIIAFDDWAFNDKERKKMQHHVGVIRWSDEYGKYQIECNDGFYEGNEVADPQLLGNIYENPELLALG